VSWLFLLLNGNTVPENLCTPSLYGTALRYVAFSERHSHRLESSPDDTRERHWRR
jgi:hypothetical protein